ncbi:uncharacterized protein [Clytia hemisphaerica]|uniref:uncharacterized protein n=1 Tax=Clytia hemisphaerica TaxID=252671 RepID=UPI0034D669BB
MEIDWFDDCNLKTDLLKYVKQNMKRSEILDYVERDFPMYNWSLRTLDRRLRGFDIYYNDFSLNVEEVETILRQELNGPGKLLGYRAMHLKLRQKYDIKIPRDYVYELMHEINPELMKDRQPCLKKKKKRKHFVTKGPDWVFSLDGHDKLMGYQNSTFPLAIYGCIDTASRKIMFLKVWVTNSKPQVIGRWYTEFLRENQIVPEYLRIDKGTETTTMAEIHCHLRQEHGDLEDSTSSIIFGPSTSNQACYL